MTRIAFSDYLAIEDATNFSRLKYIDNSPLHYQHALKHGIDDTTRLLKGRAAHTATLEVERLELDYVVFPGKRQGNAWKDFKAAHPEDSILRQCEVDEALEIRKAVLKHPTAGPLFATGKPEQVIEWVDRHTGVKCKARLDWFSRDVLADLKTTVSVDQRRFGALSARMKYHVQAAWYSDGLATALGIRPPVKLVAVEAEAPYDVAVFSLTEEDLFAGRETYQGWLERLVECRESGEWPGRYPNEEQLSLPAYVFEDDEQEDGTYKIQTGGDGDELGSDV